MPIQLALPTFESQIDTLARAEQGDGWLSACERGGRFLVLTQEFVAALSAFLGELDASPILEVCAGAGELAAALRSAGVDLVATDSDPPPGAPVARAPAHEALRLHQPAAVLGSFVPVDAGVDQLVLGFPSARHYIVLGARVGGLLGSSCLWQEPDWIVTPIDDVTRWMLTRHDVWIDRRRTLRHGEAWHFRRRDSQRGRRESAVETAPPIENKSSR
jgi:hypothetical protein